MVDRAAMAGAGPDLPLAWLLELLDYERWGAQGPALLLALLGDGL
jgi:hypothetical protein